MNEYRSLTAALEGWFDKPLRDLPVDLQTRIAEDFFPMPWHQLSPDQRRSVALQWDVKMTRRLKMNDSSGGSSLIDGAS